MSTSLTLSAGSWSDYQALAEYHYRAHRPATATRILAFRCDQPTVIGRFLGRPSQRQTVAVLVESLPALSCRLRDQALGDRYRSIRDPRARAAALNREVRCISRVVVHPQWRGRGLAVRLVRAALDTAQTPVTEALAAMGHVNPFFEHAGMIPYHRPPHPFDARLIDALAHVTVSPLDLAMLEPTMKHILALPTPQRSFLFSELARWQSHVTTHHDAQTLPDDPAPYLRCTLSRARQRLWCEPVYYLKLTPIPHPLTSNF